MRSLDGAVIKDSSGDIGFPGYDGMTGPNALAYTLDMQLHGVPVTDTYLSDLHDSWTTGTPFGPGQAGYEKQLRAENAAFGTFFHRLAAHGITKANTLFVVTADEGDHFVGSAPTPRRLQRRHRDLPLQQGRRGQREPDRHAGRGRRAHPVRRRGGLRARAVPARALGPQHRAGPHLERKLARLKELDLVSGKQVRLTNYLADPVELKLLHMVTADPKRTPSLVLFGNDNSWLSSGSASCGKSCVGGQGRHRRVEPRRRGVADQHDLAGHGRARGSAPGRGQLDLVGPHQHPAHHDGAARPAR